MLTQFQKLEKLLWHIFERKSLCEKHRRRLEWELREIDVQGKSEMFLSMFRDKKRLPHNENNVMVPWLLGLCEEFDVNRDPLFVQGDMPDIDVDYLSEVRDYLKNKWAVEKFGESHVCNIGNYMTFGLKSALIDMARVHGLPREEMLELTKNLDAKDEDGKAMTWESAMKLYPKLRQYCEEHPEVAEAARKLINRNRGMGQHAGGLIISSIPLSDLVPLVKRKDNPQASAWVEGLHGQDLQPVGLVKFDLLVISNLKQISRCCELVKQRHGLEGICALPGQPDWSDVQAWRNDPKALAMANEGDLKCIFQFDSEGIRRLVKAGGVDRFEDMVAYTSMYRPGPLGMGMHDRYTKRKRGEEPYSLHPILEPILGTTYGVMCYQEQIMQMLNIVGEIPLRDCEIVRKAISKKKLEAFKKYKQMFIQNGMKNLSLPEEQVSEIWQAVEAFSEYGFNKSLHQDTIIDCVGGQKMIKDVRAGDKVYCVGEDGEQAQTEVVAVHDHGILEVFEFIFDDGYSVKCTMNHKFLTEEGQVPAWRIVENSLEVLSSPIRQHTRWRGEIEVGSSALCAQVSETGGLARRRIVRAVPAGEHLCYDLEVACSTHNFILSNGVVTSNSHAVAYTYISSRLLYLKSHYPCEFYAAVLSCETDSDKISEYKIEARRHGVGMERVDVNKSARTFDLVGDTIYFGLGNVKGIGESAADRIVAGQPYAGFEDFLIRFGTDAAVLKCLIALRCFSEGDPVTLWKFYEHFKSFAGKLEDKKKRFLAGMRNYDEEFARLMPGERRSLGDFSGDDPFGGAEFAALDVDEVVEVEKSVETDTETGKEVVEVTYRDIPGTDDFIELHERRFIKKIKVKKKWNRLSDLKRLWARRQKALERFAESQKGTLPRLCDFNPSDHAIDKAYAKELMNQSECESKFYGFPWTHSLEKSPDFKGFTFQMLKDNEGCVSPVEVEVISCKTATSKKGTSYKSLEVEDARGERGRVNIWEDDGERWGEEFVKGNLLRLRLCPPSEGFSTYTLEKNPKQPNKRWQLKFPTKESDYRVVVLRKKADESDFQTDEEVMKQFGKAGLERK